MQICKNHKQDKSHSQPPKCKFSSQLQIYYCIFYQKAKILNFIRRVKHGVTAFYNVLSLFLTQKSPTSWNLALKTQ